MPYSWPEDELDIPRRPRPRWPFALFVLLILIAALYLLRRYPSIF